MQLVILHFHLNRGGVAQVIANQLRALQATTKPGEKVDVLVLYGGRRTGWPDGIADELPDLDVDLAEVPELEYDDEHPHPASAGELAGVLQNVLQSRGCRPSETILHIHNHSLGKSRALPGAIRTLADGGWNCLLQIHDFAEDFRPQNYRGLAEGLAPQGGRALAEILYPQGPRLHYAVLNGRDRGLLAAAGVQPERLHFLPNPVLPLDDLPPRDAVRRTLSERYDLPTDAPFLLYPVRGIRRKNVGELLLWAAALQGEAWCGMTLPPLNPAERVGYDAWKKLANELNLPLLFELGADETLSFRDNLAASDAILTTSVAEGFGMVFLEAWTAGRPLCGRDLPEITADFRTAGLNFPWLAPKLCVPLSASEQAQFQQEFADEYRRVLADFGHAVPPADRLQTQVAALIDDNTVDFAYLPRSLQESIIRSVATDTNRRNDVRALNPSLNAAPGLSPQSAAEVIANNRAAIANNFSLAASGTRLRVAYQNLLQSPAPSGESDALHAPEAILDGFLDPARFHPIRVE